METITKENFINVFREKAITFFTWEDLFKIFSLSSNTAKALLARLKKGGIVRQLTRGKYLFLLSKKLPADFEIANFIYKPSYISLESALSLYGIIDQFPYNVTSVTIRKTRNFKVNEKNFVYSHIIPDFFTDYKKESNYMIATPRKAVFDLLYLIYKGSRAKTSLKLLRSGEKKTEKRALKALIKNLSKKDPKFISFCRNQNIL